MTKQEAKAREILRQSSTKKLLDLWDETNKKKISLELATVRGWLMDEIEKRNPSGFDSWFDLDAPRDEDLRSYILA